MNAGAYGAGQPRQPVQTMAYICAGMYLTTTYDDVHLPGVSVLTNRL